MACLLLVSFGTTHASETLWLTHIPARLWASLPVHHSPDHSPHMGCRRAAAYSQNGGTRQSPSTLLTRNNTKAEFEPYTSSA